MVQHLVFTMKSYRINNFCWWNPLNPPFFHGEIPKKPMDFSWWTSRSPGLGDGAVWGNLRRGQALRTLQVWRPECALGECDQKMVVLWENHRKTIRKWLFYGKIIGKPSENGALTLSQTYEKRMEKSPFVLDNSTISMAMSIALLAYQRVVHPNWHDTWVCFHMGVKPRYWLNNCNHENESLML